MRWRARSSSLRHAGTTSTKRNSAALSSASGEARSIALSSTAFSGLRVAAASRRPAAGRRAQLTLEAVVDHADALRSIHDPRTTRLRSSTVREPACVSVVTPMHDEEGTARAFHARVRRALEAWRASWWSSTTAAATAPASVLAELAARRRAGEGHHAVAQLRPPGGAHRRRSSTPRRRRRDVDGDLQDPPELIPEMLDRWREGADVVYAVREPRRGRRAMKLATARVFYRLFARLAQIDLPWTPATSG